LAAGCGSETGFDRLLRLRNGPGRVVVPRHGDKDCVGHGAVDAIAVLIEKGGVRFFEEAIAGDGAVIFDPASTTRARLGGSGAGTELIRVEWKDEIRIVSIDQTVTVVVDAVADLGSRRMDAGVRVIAVGAETRGPQIVTGHASVNGAVAGRGAVAVSIVVAIQAQIPAIGSTV
jgi:hypothetical protein